MISDKRSGPDSLLYRSSPSYKILASLVAWFFLFAGTYVIYKSLSDWAFGSLFIIMGVIHLTLIERYVVEVRVSPSCIRVLKRSSEVSLPFHSVVEVKQITYCTNRLWRMKCRNPTRTVYFFSNYRMIEYLKENGIHVLWYRIKWLWKKG